MRNPVESLPSSLSIEEAVDTINAICAPAERLKTGIEALKHAGMQNELAALISLINRDFENALKFAPQFVSASKRFINVINELSLESNIPVALTSILEDMDSAIRPSVLEHALEKMIIQASSKSNKSGKIMDNKVSLKNVAKQVREIVNNSELIETLSTLQNENFSQYLDKLNELDENIKALISLQDILVIISNDDKLSVKSTKILAILKNMPNILEVLANAENEQLKQFLDNNIFNDLDILKIFVIGNLKNNPEYSIHKSQYEDSIFAIDTATPYAACCDIILRVGNLPPNYEQPNHGTKTGLNLSKTSNQKLFSGFILKDVIFTRIGSDGNPLGHDDKDATHLLLPVTDPDYQHTIPLEISMQKIVKDLQESNGQPGDLIVESYDEGYLTLRYIQGDTFHGYTGPIVIDLTARNSNKDEILYSRTWYGFEMQELKNNKPVALSEVPQEIYEAAFSYVVPVYTFHDASEQSDEMQPMLVNSQVKGFLKPIYAFANVVQNPEELTAEIKKQLNAGTILSDVKFHLENMHQYATRKNILDFFKIKVRKFFKNTSEYKALKAQVETAVHAIDSSVELNTDEKNEQISIIREKYKSDLAKLEQQFQNRLDKDLLIVLNAGAKIVVGDHDTLARGCPNVLLTPELQEFTTIRNTFVPGENIQALTQAMYDYFDILKYCSLPESTLHNLLRNIDSAKEIMSDFALSRAGCINAHQFMQNQLINYAFKAQEAFYAEQSYHVGLQAALDTALHEFSQNTILAKDVETRAKALYVEFQKEAGVTLPAIIQDEINVHLTRHVKRALGLGNTQGYQIPHPQKDFHIDEYFRHGDEAENPYGCNYAGAWLLMSNGHWISGTNQESLAQLMTVSNLLERSYIDNNYGADMNAGWGLVIERQLQLGQPVKAKTHLNYLSWKVEQKLQANEPVLTTELINYNKWKMIQLTELQKKNKQMIMTPGWANVIEKILEQRLELNEHIYSLYSQWKSLNSTLFTIQEEPGALEEKFNEPDESTHLLSHYNYSRYSGVHSVRELELTELLSQDSASYNLVNVQDLDIDADAVLLNDRLWNSLMDEAQGKVKVTRQRSDDAKAGAPMQTPEKKGHKRRQPSVDLRKGAATTLHRRPASFFGKAQLDKIDESKQSFDESKQSEEQGSPKHKG